MSEDLKALTREQLYELLWEEPTSKLARRYGISDVAISKLCRRLNIPKPPVGYWQRKSRGRRVMARPSLPKLQSDSGAAVLKQREPAAPKPDRLASFPEELRQFVQSEVSTIPVRAVAERLSSPHPVTTYLRQKLELGVDSRTVAKLLDHASFRTTEESYLADRAKEKRRAMKLYEDTYLQGILDDSIGFPARDGECWVPPRQDP